MSDSDSVAEVSVDDATRALAPIPAPAPASSDESTMTWAVEEISSDECQKRACRISADIDQDNLWEPCIAAFVKSTAILLNAPEGYISHHR